MNPAMRSMRKWHADRLERGEDQSGVPLMTEAAIKAACLRHDGYESPELNESIYLHFRGFMRIENLEPYTSVKALFLESNNLRRIEGVDHLVSLRALFLQQNALARIEGLSGLTNLNTLNLSQNAIERIDTGALAGLPALATLVLSKNRFQTAADVEAILECPSITNVDLSSNDIEDADVVSIVAGLPNLACLSLTGNPFLRTTRQYRKSTLVAMPKLTHLDDRPVFEEERIAVTAWEKGGATAERDARKGYKEEMQKRERAQMEAYREWVEKKRVERAAKLVALNAERAEQGLDPLTALPPKTRVRYVVGDSASLDREPASKTGEGAAAAAASAASSTVEDDAHPAAAAMADGSGKGVEVVDELVGGVMRDRSDRLIGVVPGAIEGITPEAAAMMARIEAGEDISAQHQQTAQSSDDSDAGEAEALASRDTAHVPEPQAVVPPPLGIPVDESKDDSEQREMELSTAEAIAASAPRPDVTLSDEQNAVYQSLRLYSRRRGDEVPESTVAGDTVGRAARDSARAYDTSHGGGSDSASIVSDSTMWTSASAAGGSGAATDSSRAPPMSSVAGTAGARGVSSSSSSSSSNEALWSMPIDKALRKLVLAVKFDWPRAASALQKAIRTGRLAPPPGPVSAGLSLTRTASLFSPEAVRDRYAALTATPASHTDSARDSGTGSASVSLRQRVAAAGATTADTGVATAVALATASEAKKHSDVLGVKQRPRESVLPASSDALPLDRLLRGPRFELSSYSDHIKPASLPSVSDFEPDAKDAANCTVQRGTADGVAVSGPIATNVDEEEDDGDDAVAAAPMSRAEIIASLRHSRYAATTGGADVAHLGLGGSGGVKGAKDALHTTSLLTEPTAEGGAAASVAGSAGQWSAGSARAASATGSDADTASETAMASSDTSESTDIHAAATAGVRAGDRYRMIGLHAARPQASHTAASGAGDEAESDGESETAASVGTAASVEWIGGPGSGGWESAGGAPSAKQDDDDDVDGMD